MVTKLTMKQVQIIGVNDEQITSKIDSIMNLDKDPIIGPFETIDVKGIIKLQTIISV